MEVAQPLERTFDHLIVEAMRSLEHRDARDEALPDAKVAAFEGDQVAELEQAFGAPRRDHPFRRKRRRFAMGVHIAGEVEAEFDGRADFGFDDDRGHELRSKLSW